MGSLGGGGGLTGRPHPTVPVDQVLYPIPSDVSKYTTPLSVLISGATPVLATQSNTVGGTPTLNEGTDADARDEDVTTSVKYSDADTENGGQLIYELSSFPNAPINTNKIFVKANDESSLDTIKVQVWNTDTSTWDEVLAAQDAAINQQIDFASKNISKIRVIVEGGSTIHAIRVYEAYILTDAPIDSIDDNNATSTKITDVNPWARYEMSATADKKPAGVYIRLGAATNLTSFAIEVSQDGATWTRQRVFVVGKDAIIDTDSFLKFNVPKEFVRFYRIYALDTDSKTLEIAETKVHLPTSEELASNHGHEEL